MLNFGCLPGHERQPPTERQEWKTFKIPDTPIYPTYSPQLPITELPSENSETPLLLANEMQLWLPLSLCRIAKGISDSNLRVLR